MDVLGNDLTEVGRAIMEAINDIIEPGPSNVTACSISDVLEKLVQTHRGDGSELAEKSKSSWNTAFIDLNAKGYIESNNVFDSNTGKQNLLILTQKGLDYVNSLRGF